MITANSGNQNTTPSVVLDVYAVTAELVIRTIYGEVDLQVQNHGQSRLFLCTMMGRAREKHKRNKMWKYEHLSTNKYWTKTINTNFIN